MDSQKNIVQKWVSVYPDTEENIVRSLDVVTQRLLKENKNFYPATHSVCYNPEKGRYVVLVSFERPREVGDN